MVLKAGLFIIILLRSAAFGQGQLYNENHRVPPTNRYISSLIIPQRSVTHCSLADENVCIRYQEIARTLILKNNEDKPICSMFHVAYFTEGVTDQSQRPVIFIYNGGAGSCPLLPHMRSWRHQRVEIKDTQRVLSPYHTVNKEYSLLDVSNPGLIDAPGIGFSRIIIKDNSGACEPKDFYDIELDRQPFANFITCLSLTNCRKIFLMHILIVARCCI